eukprot:1260157-Rhodomonas_salina.3
MGKVLGECVQGPGGPSVGVKRRTAHARSHHTAFLFILLHTKAHSHDHDLATAGPATNARSYAQAHTVVKTTTPGSYRRDIHAVGTTTATICTPHLPAPSAPDLHSEAKRQNKGSAAVSSRRGAVDVDVDVDVGVDVGVRQRNQAPKAAHAPTTHTRPAFGFNILFLLFLCACGGRVERRPVRVGARAGVFEQQVHDTLLPRLILNPRRRSLLVHALHLRQPLPRPRCLLHHTQPPDPLPSTRHRPCLRHHMPGTVASRTE